MKVIKAFGPQDLRIVEVATPEPGPGQILIKVRASGICGSDKWIWSVGQAIDDVVGHEVAGEVTALGTNVTSFSVGDRVMVNNVGGCGDCSACRAGAFVLCICREKSPGDVNNGYGEYVVAPAVNCAKILPGLDFIDGALIMDNWGTPYAGLLRGGASLYGTGVNSAGVNGAGFSGVGPGIDVLINGCGPIGQAAISLAKAFGAYVIATDPIPWRREVALKSGANVVVAPEELTKAAHKLTNGLGVHLVLECSGDGNAYQHCFESLRNQGTIVTIGENAEFTFRPSDQVLRRALSVVGTWYSTMAQAGELMQLALQNRINVKSFLTHKVSLEEVPGLFGSIVARDPGMMKCVVVFD